MTHRSRIRALLALAALAAGTIAPGCHRGRPSAEPPVHLVPDMDTQPKYQSQEASSFFDDGMAMRKPVEGTIARGHLNGDSEFLTGRHADSTPLAVAPVPYTTERMHRGRERFDIYCSPCHGRLGDGEGMVSKRGMLPPPTLHTGRLRDTADGYFFAVMTEGKGNMPTYRHQITPADRWAIVAYIRALQRSQNATLADLPAPAQPDSTQKATGTP